MHKFSNILTARRRRLLKDRSKLAVVVALASLFGAHVGAATGHNILSMAQAHAAAFGHQVAVAWQTNPNRTTAVTGPDFWEAGALYASYAAWMFLFVAFGPWQLLKVGARAQAADRVRDEAAAVTACEEAANV